MNSKNSSSGSSGWLKLGAAVLVSTVLHEGACGRPITKTLDTLGFEPLREWVKKRDQEVKESKLSEKARGQLELDKEEVNKLNEERLKLIAQREVAANSFKAMLYQEYKKVDLSDIFYKVEYFSQGITDEENEIAKFGLESMSDKIQISMLAQDQFVELEKIRKEVFLKGEANPTKSSAAVAMVHNMDPEWANCVARGRTAAMLLARKYPDLQEKIFFQIFGDHILTGIEIDGNRYLLERGELMAFPDARTLKVKNKIMPIWVWLAVYAGHAEEEFKDFIEVRGHETTDETGDYARVTDELVKGISGKGLGNVGTADSWFGRGGNGSGNATNPVSAGSADAKSPIAMPSNSQAAAVSSLANATNAPGVNRLKDDKNNLYFSEEHFKTSEFEAKLDKIGEETHNIRITAMKTPSLKKIAQIIDRVNKRDQIQKEAEALDSSKRKYVNANVHFEISEVDDVAAILKLFKGASDKMSVYLPVKTVTKEIMDIIVNQLDLKMYGLQNVENFTVEAANMLVSPKLTNFFFEDLELLPPEADSEVDLLPSKTETVNLKPSVGQRLNVSFVNPGNLDARVGEVLVQEGVVFSITNGKKLGFEFGKALSKRDGFVVKGGASAEFFKGLSGMKGKLRLYPQDGQINAEAAKELAELEGVLDFGYSVNSLSIFVKTLENRKGKTILHLSKPDMQNPEFAAALVTHIGDLEIDGMDLGQKDDATLIAFLKKLSVKKGKLHLKFANAVSNEVLDVLASFESDVHFDFQINNKESVRKENWEPLLKRKKMQIRVNTSSREQSNEVLSILMRHEGELQLDSVYAITEEMAGQLIKHKGKLILPHATITSLKVYDILAVKRAEIEVREEDQGAFAAGVRDFFVKRADWIIERNKRGP